VIHRQSCQYRIDDPFPARPSSRPSRKNRRRLGRILAAEGGVIFENVLPVGGVDVPEETALVVLVGSIQRFFQPAQGIEKQQRRFFVPGAENSPVELTGAFEMAGHKVVLIELRLYRFRRIEDLRNAAAELRQGLPQLGRSLGELVRFEVKNR
jgi:hypothetical protein